MRVAALLFAILLAPCAAAAEPDCAALGSRHLADDLALTWTEFDQVPGKGWRALEEAGCLEQAADVIEAWIAKNGQPHASLIWHVAQLRAHLGDNAAAIAAARSALDEDEAIDADFKWNAYVRATIAFLEQDRAAFDAHRATLQRAVDLHRGNKVNLTLLDKLAAGFGKSYAEALAAK